MRKLALLGSIGFWGLLIFPVFLQAQTPAVAPSVKVSPQAVGHQAPDDAVVTLKNLVHQGKYAEAQQLDSGLLIAYPDDQRLIKAKALLDQLATAAGPADATPSKNQPANDATAQVSAITNPLQLNGMDKVEYNSLIEMARQAQQNADLDQQKILLEQFMTESRQFLQKYPNLMVVWQIRAASSLVLNDPDSGYEAGQRLLAAGAADSDNPNIQQLISKLKIKGWLDSQGVVEAKQKIEEDEKYDWLLGTWHVTGSWFSKAAFDYGERHNAFEVIFSKTDSGAAGFVVIDGVKRGLPAYRYAVANSTDVPVLGNWGVFHDKSPLPITSFSIDRDRRTMTFVFMERTFVFTKN